MKLGMERKNDGNTKATVIAPTLIKGVRPGLAAALQECAGKCMECNLCVKQCKFLQKYGNPKHIAACYNPTAEQERKMPFECSLCNLCGAVCPVKISPGAMFLEMRREAVDRNLVDFKAHKTLRKYEQRGKSHRYSFLGIPEGCHTIFFPGCALAGTRPESTLRLYNVLASKIPGLGVMLDCCSKPSHDLGRQHHFETLFGKMRDRLVAAGVQRVVLACPSCYAVFSRYGGKLISKMAYDFLQPAWVSDVTGFLGRVTVQDSCVARFDPGLHATVRKLLTRTGIEVKEMKHHGLKTVCCGEGGAVSFMEPPLAANWGEIRRREADGLRIVTYCAGCAYYLGRVGVTAHLLDVIFDPIKTLAGKAKVSKAPLTYLNRLLLKRKFRKIFIGFGDRGG
jgi:Fe-S oxidoreductase